MIRRASTYLFVAMLGLAALAVAQTPLTLTKAIARARNCSPRYTRTASSNSDVA